MSEESTPFLIHKHMARDSLAFEFFTLVSNRSGHVSSQNYHGIQSDDTSSVLQSDFMKSGDYS